MICVQGAYSTSFFLNPSVFVSQLTYRHNRWQFYSQTVLITYTYFGLLSVSYCHCHYYSHTISGMHIFISHYIFTYSIGIRILKLQMACVLIIDGIFIHTLYWLHIAQSSFTVLLICHFIIIAICHFAYILHFFGITVLTVQFGITVLTVQMAYSFVIDGIFTHTFKLWHIYSYLLIIAISVNILFICHLFICHSISLPLPFAKLCIKIWHIHLKQLQMA